MHQQAENLLIQTVKQRLEMKSKELNLPIFSAIMDVDTIPLTISVFTAEGKKEYQVDSLKSNRNISQSFNERTLHSIICQEEMISCDTLQRVWTQTLCAHKIYAEANIFITLTTLDGEEITSGSVAGEELPSFPTEKFLLYIGNRCEVGLVGTLDYFWWSILIYSGAVFLLILVILVVVVGICYYLCVGRPHSLKRKMFVVKESLCEGDLPVKELVNAKVRTYQLRPGLIFDPYKQVLLVEGKEVRLASQSCVILELFLQAPNYTLSDAELLKSIWGNDKTATMKRFTVAYSRLCKALKGVGFKVEFKRIGIDKYRMLFTDNQ